MLEVTGVEDVAKKKLFTLLRSYDHNFKLADIQLSVDSIDLTSAATNLNSILDTAGSAWARNVMEYDKNNTAKTLAPPTAILHSGEIMVTDSQVVIDLSGAAGLHDHLQEIGTALAAATNHEINIAVNPLKNEIYFRGPIEKIATMQVERPKAALSV